MWRCVEVCGGGWSEGACMVCGGVLRCVEVGGVRGHAWCVEVCGGGWSEGACMVCGGGAH